MKHLSDDFEFNVHWKPFMLNPYMPEEGMSIMDYLRLKFGDEAAERFVSGSSPVSQQGKAAVRYLLAYTCIHLSFLAHFWPMSETSCSSF